MRARVLAPMMAPMIARVMALMVGVGALLTPAAAQEQRPAPTFEQVLVGQPAYRARPAPWRWQGDLLATLRAGEDRRLRWVLVDPATGEERGPVVDAGRERRRMHARALAALPGWPRGDRRAELAARGALARAQTGRAGEGDEAASWLMAAVDGRVFLHHASDVARRLSSEDERARLARARRDGSAVAWISGHDLVVADAAGRRRQLTRGGGDALRHGIHDWVYQEELYGRGNWRAYWWSPDGRWIALLRLDGAAVPEHPIVDLRRGARLIRQRYPKAGQPNPVVSVGVIDVDAALASDEPVAPAWVDLSGSGDAERLVVRVDWTPDNRLLVCVQDRAQRWLERLRVDPRAPDRPTRVDRREAKDGWVSRPRAPRWLPDGSSLQLSDATGYRHLYRVSRDGERTALTAGEWSVRRVVRVDADSVVFSATVDGAIDNRLYRAPLVVEEPTTAPQPLTPDPGWHRAQLSGDGRWILDSYSSVSEPGRVVLRGRDGALVRELARAQPAALTTHAFARASLVTLRARDGYPLDACLIRPPGPGPHALYVRQYSGPNAMSVRNQWYGDPWDQFLVGQGVAVLRVNVRSASGRGMAHTKTCYRQLGVQELRDLEDAVAALTKQPAFDARRVGIVGSSYGGFMAAFALTHSERFRLGVAMSGVYDWRLYDTIYTERFMDTPARNPEGYAKTSVIRAAKDLRGALLITHGTLDDNVHVQNAMQLFHALQRAGKADHVELRLYSGAGHGIGDPAQRRDLRVRVWRAIQRHLLAE